MNGEDASAWPIEFCRPNAIVADIVYRPLETALLAAAHARGLIAVDGLGRLSLTQVRDTAEQVSAGLADLSVAHGATFFRLNPAWYGFDPIHIRPSLWRPAWQEILGSRSDADGHSRLEGLRLYLMPPERRWLFGVEHFTPQSGVALASGGRVWLY
jgi:hypothetical protein